MTISRAFNNLVVKLSAASRTDSPVLLTGETGTGKRQAAMSMHRSSIRREARFVTINCIGITDERFELELCGSQSSSFEMNRKGALFLAEAGTLYLHEVGELSKRSQSLLLRCIESGVYTPVGGNDPIQMDVRVVASCSNNLQAMTEAGYFRTDLFHFLAAVIIATPSLNDRLEDIPRLANMMLGELSPDKSLSLSEPALHVLMGHSFSGNLVELKNIIHRALTQLPADSTDAVVGLSVIEGAINASGTVSARDASAREQSLVSDYMPADKLGMSDALTSPKQTLTYGLQTSGRWAPADASGATLDDADLASLDAPSPISAFSNEDEQVAQTAIAQRPVVTRSQVEDKSTGSASSSDLNTKKHSAFMNLKDQEKQYLTELLAKCDGDKRAAAKIAGITLRTLYRKLEGL